MSAEKRSLLLCLPPNYQFDQDALWNNLVALFKTSFEKRDLFNLKKALGQLEYYSNVGKQYLGATSDPKEITDAKIKKYYSMILSPLFDFITTLPFIDFGLQSQAAKLFAKLTRKYQYRPSPSEVHLSLQKTLDTFDELFIIPRRHMTKPLTALEVGYYIIFFGNIHYFFDDADGDVLLEKYLDKLGCPESVSFISTLSLLRFYPTSENCFKKIFNHIIPLIENPILNPVTSAVISYFTSVKVGSFNNKYFDWKPYLRSIFNVISSSLNSEVTILGDKLNTDDNKGFPTSIGIIGAFSKDSIPVFSSLFISSLLIEHDEEKGQETTVAKATLSILKDLVTAFVPMITPKSKKAENLVTFVVNIIYNFSSLYERINLLKKKDKEQVEGINISKELIDQFVTILLPFVQAALFNGKPSVQETMVNAVAPLAQLSYELTMNALVPFCLNNMVDPEMTATSKTCFNVIKNLIPTMLNEEHIEENYSKIPTIIDGALERCKNSMLKNYFLGMSVLSEIAQFISIPADKEMNSKLSIKQRMAATAMINSLEVIIKCHFEHNKRLTTDQSENPYNNMLTGTTLKDTPETIPSSNKKTHIKKPKNHSKDLDKRFECYFAAFDDSYIESIVIPNVLKQIKSASNAAFLNNYTYKFTKYLSRAKPDLIARSLAPKLEEFFVKSNTTRKSFWSQLLASTFVACPTFLEKIPHYVELINNLLAIKEESESKTTNDDQDDEIECNFKCAQVLISELINKVPGPNIIDWSNSEENPNDDKIKWGVVYKKYEIHPKWYEIDQNVINTTIDSIFKAVQPHMEKFASYTLKKQKIIDNILCNFMNLFNMRGKFGQLEFNDHHENETYTRIEKSIFVFINEMLQKLQSYKNKEEILSLLSNSLFNYNGNYIKFVQACDCLNKKKFNLILSEKYAGVKLTRYYCLLRFQQEVFSSLYNFDYIITPNVELVLDNVLSLVESEFASISHRAISILEKFSVYSPKIHNDYILKQLSILENPNKTEYQCKGAMLYLMKLSMKIIMRNPELIVRLFKALISLKYEKDWKISDYLNSLITAAEFYRSIIKIEESKVWRDFINDILNIPRTIDPRQFIFILRFIVFQEPVPSPEIVRFIINSLKNQSDANRLVSMSCLSHLLCIMKPVAPRSNFTAVEEFKGADGLIPYVDKISVGFHCKPHHYVFYTGPSVFTEKTKKYDEIRKFLTDEIFNNDKIFAELFESFTLLHHTEDNPRLIKNIYDLWKGIGQIIRTSIVKHTKSLIFNVLDVSNIAKITPVQLATLCELIAGISRATKHWTAEEKKLAIDEILIPACTPIIRLKGCDLSTSCVQVMASSMIQDWDYRRVQWLFDIIEKIFSECLESKENIKEMVLRSGLNIGKAVFIEAGPIFNKEFIRIMKNILIPLFSDLKAFKLDFISSFASFITCRLQLTSIYHPQDSNKENNYYNAPSFKISNELASLPFEIFDKGKKETPELIALFLSEIFTEYVGDYSFFVPFIAERFADIIEIDTKLIDITSGKFLHYGKNIICKLGFLAWKNLEEKLDDVLFDKIIKNDIMAKRESLPWNSKLNLVGFLHALTFSNIFLFTKKEFSIFIDDVIPSFLSDNSQEVRTAAQALLRVLVCIVYNDCWDKCAEKIAFYFQEAAKDKSKGKINKNLYIAVSFACALLDNTNVWFNGCPEWLPAIFDPLERTYSRGDCKVEIKNCVAEFFTRHRGKELPEIEDYKYSFSEGYFT